MQDFIQGPAVLRAETTAPVHIQLFQRTPNGLDPRDMGEGVSSVQDPKGYSHEKGTKMIGCGGMAADWAVKQ